MNRAVLAQEIRKPATQPYLPPPEKFDVESILPLALIRNHVKADDVPRVTDEQLILYRRTALEMAEKYTGLFLFEQRHITEDIDLPSPSRQAWARNPWYLFETKYPIATGIAYVYGLPNQASQTIHAAKGSRAVKIPMMHMDFGLNSCCKPCAAAANGPKLMYVAGFSGCDEIPGCVIVGALKLTAWLVGNAGDELVTMKDANVTSDQGIGGTNNAVWASGALEMWRGCNDMAAIA